MVRNIMYVKSMDTMESIVISKDDLFWESFNVVELKSISPNAPLKKQARYINGQWHNVKVYELTPNGWDVPKTWVS